MAGSVVNRQTAVVVPGVSPDVFPWDKYPLPRVLYKYFPPERLHVLTQCLIRFSQRQVFEDVYDLRPDVASFGNEDAILEFMAENPALSRHPPWLREVVAYHVLNTPGREAALIRQTQEWLTEPDNLGVLCLTENPVSDRMWEQYTNAGHGFVVAFDTAHPTFIHLRSPERIGKVEYTDEPVPDFLTRYRMNAYFQKRTQYEFEAEWRSIRGFSRFQPEDIRHPKDALPIYLAPFDPACIAVILIKSQCTVEWALRTLTAIDARYRHVAVKFSR